MSIKRIATICACLCALFAVVDFFSIEYYFGSIGYYYSPVIVALSQDIALLTIAFFFFVLRNKTNK